MSHDNGFYEANGTRFCLTYIFFRNFLSASFAGIAVGVLQPLRQSASVEVERDDWKETNPRSSGYSYGTETKVFGEPKLSDGTLASLGRNEGVRKMQTAERAAVVGSPDLESLTTSHIERAFLTVRQELKRFQRKGLGYSKSLEIHQLAIALHFGVYNFVRKHHTLGTTPAVAGGLEEKAWSLEQVVEMTQAYFQRKAAV